MPYLLNTLGEKILLSTRLLLAVASWAALTLQPTMAFAELYLEKKENITEQLQSQSLQRRGQVTYDAYIIGSGDKFLIELLDLPEMSGEFTIGPDGILYLPRLRALQVEGLTIEELRLFLTDQFRAYVLQPEVYITPIGYRPVRVYVGGEVARPGYYTIRGSVYSQDFTLNRQRSEITNSGTGRAQISSIQSNSTDGANIEMNSSSTEFQSPTLFDALQSARGVTPFSQLDQVQVTRKRPLSQGGGKIRTSVNFLRLIKDGDEDANIRLYDGDAIFVRKSEDALREQLLAASRTNLSPDFIEVFVSGRVKEPGPQQLPQGASLNQAIASAGGPKLLRGRIEFLRFTQDGETDRRLFGYNPKATSGDYRNPVLMSGDVVRINESIASASLELLNEITAPAVGVYSVYSIYRDVQQ